MPRDIPTHEMLAHVLGEIEQQSKEIGEFVKDCQRQNDHASVASYKIAKHQVDKIKDHVEALWKVQVSRHEAKAQA